jgi:hypothetical protein
MAQLPPPPPDVETEHRLTALETRLDAILPTLATKADIAEVKATIAATRSSLLIWGMTTAVAVVAILVSVLLFVAQQLELAPSDSDSASQAVVRRLPTASVPISDRQPQRRGEPRSSIATRAP